MSRELQDILDSGEITGLTLDPVTSPTHTEGNVFYSSVEKALSYQTDVSGVELTVGQEFYRRVYNDSGAQIDNGTVVRSNGVYAASNLPTIEAALADTLEHSMIIGVATHDIADGSAGFVTTHGLVRDIDLTAFTEGNFVFLSDSVAGDLTESFLDLPTLVGIVIDNSATGILLVRVHSNISVPHAVGFLSGNATVYTLSATYQTLTSWTSAESAINNAVASTGLITVPYTGLYRFNITVDASFTAVPGSNEIYFQFYNATDATQMGLATYRTVTGQTYIQDTFSLPISVSALAKDYSLRVGANTTFNNFTLNTITFDIETIRMDFF